MYPYWLEEKKKLDPKGQKKINKYATNRHTKLCFIVSELFFSLKNQKKVHKIKCKKKI